MHLEKHSDAGAPKILIENRIKATKDANAPEDNQ
jgi:hypothetical protein